MTYKLVDFGTIFQSPLAMASKKNLNESILVK